MTQFWIFMVSAFSISLPAVAVLLRRPVFLHRYLPFSCLLWAGLLNEGISYFMILHRRNNMANSNMYTLVEFGLFLWLFYRLGSLKKNAGLVLLMLGSLLWITDNLVWHNLSDDNGLFRLLAAACIIYLSIDRINQFLFNGSGISFKGSGILLCFAFSIHFIYKVFLIIFNLFPMGLPADFYARLWLIFGLVNLVTNLLYLITILWIPKQTAYTLH